MNYRILYEKHIEKIPKDWHIHHIDFAHDNGMKCHIGQVGKLEYLELANELGADSVDSTSWVRNKSWHIIEQFRNRRQGRLEL